MDFKDIGAIFKVINSEVGPYPQLTYSEVEITDQEDIIVRGDFFKHLIELDSPKILNRFRYKDISNIIDSNYFRNIDLSLYHFKDRTFSFDKIVKLFDVDNSNLVQDDSKMKEYFNILIDRKDNIKFMNPDSFVFSELSNKIATYDFRILIDDDTGKVNKRDMLHVASIAKLALSGLIEIPICHQEIEDYLSKYGEVEIKFSSNGYLHLKLFKKDRFRLNIFKENPKSNLK